MKKIYTCKRKITWGGRICYGTSFQIASEKDSIYATCEKCGEKYSLIDKK